VAVGPAPLSLHDVALALIGRTNTATVAIVRAIRLPRVALAGLIGAALAISGAVLQGSLRNPLAEPYLLGVSGGAAVGAVLAVAAGLGGSGVALPLAAFAGAVGAVVLVLAIARAAGAGARGDPRVLLMAGVIVGAFANAVIMVALANAPASAVRGATWWMMGSAGDATWDRVVWLAVSVAVAGTALFAWGREIDALALGQDAAASLGVDASRATRRVYVASAVLAAATVAAAGLIGFVGLVVPHIARAAGVRQQRPLIVAAALIGATLVVGADIVARTVARPAELPLGAITALIGVPFFLLQLRRLG
jgi:iron complex transport system permease protein